MRLSQANEEFKDYREFKVSKTTVKRYYIAIRTFALCMKDKDIENVSMEDILNYLLMMKDMGWKRNGVQIVSTALRKFFEYLKMREFDVINWQLIPLPKKEFNIPRVATEKQFNAVIEEMMENYHRPHNIRNVALTSLLWDTGARSGEICSLNPNDETFNLKERQATIHTEKSRGKRPVRQIFWTEQTAERLDNWLKKREHLMGKFEFEDPEALFVTISKTKKNSVRGRRMDSHNVAEMLRTWSNRAEIETLNAHSMRHKLGRDIIEDKQGTLADVQNILGHSSIDSSQIYTMLWGNDLKNRWEMFRGKKDVKNMSDEDIIANLKEWIENKQLSEPVV